MTCNRTKATSIANNVLNPLSITELKNDLQDMDFISVSTDASNHGNIKLFPIIIQYFNYKKNGITSKLLDIENTENETANTITELIIKQLRQHNLLSKCIAFSGDNCNTNFGGRERIGINNVFHNLQVNLNSNIVGVDCSAHIIHNAMHRGCDLLPVDVESIILKIYNYFSVYTVRTESLKEFCTAADTEYKQLLFHSKTRWLSLFPAIERFLKLYEPIKTYFESLDEPPVLIKKFFADPFSEAYLFLIHSIMHILHSKIEKLEKSDNSILETRNILTFITKSLNNRINEIFLPLKVQNILNNQDENTKNECIKCCMDFYNKIKTYIENWIKPLNEFEKFDWMFLPNLTENTPWTVVENTVLFLQEKNIIINETKLLDEWINLKTFSKNLSKQDKLLTANQLCKQAVLESIGKTEKYHKTAKTE
ncbi:protein FAM200A-like [Cardiocondyla obscurior]|uniref:protein FAM200A-like n=1 Tax=Cardiocondyla obscurior TaxID=286306 RepID=UPI003965755D